MRKIVALASKDLRLLFRDKSGFAFTFFFPLVFALFFGLMYSPDSGPEAVPIAVVDQDSTAASQAFVARLDSSTELQVHRAVDTCTARELVRKRRCVALVVLPPGFGQRRQNPFAQGPPRILLGFDPAQNAAAGMVEGILTKYAAEDLSDLFADPRKFRTSIRAALDSLQEDTSLPTPRKRSLLSFLSELDRFLADEDTSASSHMQGFEPLKVETLQIVNPRSGPPNAFAVTFPQGIVFGIIGVVSGFSLTLVTERKNGTLDRIRALPVTGTQLLAGKALGCFAAVVGVVIGLLLVAVAFFGVRVHSWPLLLAASASVGVAFVGLMMLFAVLGHSERSVSSLVWGVMLPLAMLGGAMIPLMFMPSWLRSISSLSPVKWAILSLEGALWRGFSAKEMLFPCSVLLAIGIAAFFLGVKLFPWTTAENGKR